MNGNPNSDALKLAKQEAFSKMEENYSGMHANHNQGTQSISNPNATEPHKSVGGNLYNSKNANDMKNNMDQDYNRIQTTEQSNHATNMQSESVAHESTTQRVKDKAKDMKNDVKDMYDSLKSKSGSSGDGTDNHTAKTFGTEKPKDHYNSGYPPRE